jgi:hypothetical protein
MRKMPGGSKFLIAMMLECAARLTIRDQKCRPYSNDIAETGYSQLLIDLR